MNSLGLSSTILTGRSSVLPACGPRISVNVRVVLPWPSSLYLRWNVLSVKIASKIGPKIDQFCFSDKIFQASTD